MRRTRLRTVQAMQRPAQSSRLMSAHDRLHLHRLLAKIESGVYKIEHNKIDVEFNLPNYSHWINPSMKRSIETEVHAAAPEATVEYSVKSDFVKIKNVTAAQAIEMIAIFSGIYGMIVQHTFEHKKESAIPAENV